MKRSCPFKESNRQYLLWMIKMSVSEQKSDFLKTCICHCELYSFRVLKGGLLTNISFSVSGSETCQCGEDQHNSVSQHFQMTTVTLRSHVWVPGPFSAQRDQQLREPESPPAGSRFHTAARAEETAPQHLSAGPGRQVHGPQKGRQATPPFSPAGPSEVRLSPEFK